MLQQTQLNVLRRIAAARETLERLLSEPVERGDVIAAISDLRATTDIIERVRS